MDYTTLLDSLPSLVACDGEKPEQVGRSLYQALTSLSDPRRKQGQRYSLPLLLCLVLLAKLAGQTSLSGATEWVRLRAKKIAQLFGLKRDKMPCQMTYCRMLANLDPHEVDEVLAAFFVHWEASQRCGSEPSCLQTSQAGRQHEQVAIDGKTIRATCKQQQKTHLLSCYDVATATVLWQSNVEEKQNEISALKGWLTPALVKGRVVSMDAMHTQRETCSRIQGFGGYYLLIAKDNQPSLLEDITDLFADPAPDRRRWAQAESWDKGHGRLEHREIVCSPDLNEWFGKNWLGIEQVFRVERSTTIMHTGEHRHQIVYGFSNLPMSDYDPAHMLALVRHHWLIENRLHWRRDVTLGEDECQSRTGKVPASLARLNTAVLSLMDRLGVKNVARQIRYFDAHVEQAARLLLTGQCFIY